MPLNFVKPSMEYISSFIEALEEGPFTHMGLADFGDATAEEVRADPKKYLEKLNDTSPREVDTPSGDKFIFSDHFIIWAIDENNRFIGGISFRFDDNDLINKYCGHAGMSVRQSLLYKGYGVKAAQELLSFCKEEARKRGISELYASADPDNPASWKILEYLGGALISEENLFEMGDNKFYSLEI